MSAVPLPCLGALDKNSRPLGIYVHIPFCVAKCCYCDFNSYPDLEELHQPYLSALIQELRCHSALLREPAVDSIYIGGGTPTVLPPGGIGNILSALHQYFKVEASAEVTLEANPGTIDREALGYLHQRGVNRLSLGVQSLDNNELRLLGRIHDVSQVYVAVRAARAAGFTDVNLDLIYGLPGQNTANWLNSLEEALRLEPDHLSLYCLTLEEGTPLCHSVHQGTLPEPDPDLAAEMYERARDLLAQRHFEHYELSNWARPGAGASSRADTPQRNDRVCRHNVKYWTGQPYLGVGAGAHSYVDHVRWQNIAHPQAFVEAMGSHGHAIREWESLTHDDRMAEAMFLGLRLIQGVRWDDLTARLGQDPRQRYKEELADLDSLGLLAVDKESARLTPRGQLLANEVFVRFLPNVGASK